MDGRARRGTRSPQTERRAPSGAHTTPAQLRDALREVDGDGDDVEAIIQFGANLAFARQAADAERWLGKPVIEVNTATYWHALRESGIPDPVRGFGALLEQH